MSPETMPFPKAGSTRYQMLDVWRGLVCLLVVVEHAGVALWPRTNGGSSWADPIQRGAVWLLTRNLGTPLFFVMSGFCIAASLESLHRKGGTPLSFLGRRLWRILPTYWAALLFFFLVVAWLDRLGFQRLHDSEYGLSLVSPETLNPAQWFGNLTLIETWRPHLFGGPSSVFTRVAWSLCYQEQFYIVCVLALWLAPARVERFLALATAAILLVRVFAWDCGALEPMFEGTFPYLWHEFAIGLAVYWRLNRPSPQWAKRAVEAGLVVLAIIGFQTDFTSTLAAACFGLLLIGMYRWDRLAGSLRLLNPLRACGKRSYSIYLAHLPITTVVSTLCCDLGMTGFGSRALILLPLVTLLGVAAGWLMHWTVESHFLGQPSFFRLPEAPLGSCQALISA